jgi:hypothetical protein
MYFVNNNNMFFENEYKLLTKYNVRLVSHTLILFPNSLKI